MKATPTWPATAAALVIEGAATAGTIVTTKVDGAPRPPVFAARSVAENVPATVGVPVIAPVVELIVNPAGRPLARNEVGLALAVV